MAVSMMFGLPRSGKTTLLSALAIKNKDKYQNIYSNVRLDLPFVQYIQFEWLGKYNIHDGLVLIDEATVFADSRAYKDMMKSFSDFLMLHGHWKLDIVFFAQRYNGVDIKIRNLTVNLYYVRKCLIPSFTSYTPIEYRMVVPNAGERIGDIVEGYQQLGWFRRLLFTRYIYRPKYYAYFDSWERPDLPPIPCLPPAAQSTKAFGWKPPEKPVDNDHMQ